MRKQFWKCFLWKSNFEEHVFLREQLKKMSFLRKKFQKCLSWGSNFKNAFFEGAILKMYVLSPQFEKFILKMYFLIFERVTLKTYFWMQQLWKMYFFERAILKVFEGAILEIFFEMCLLREQFWKCILKRK